jgi:hypothetical protein
MPFSVAAIRAFGAAGHQVFANDTFLLTCEHVHTVGDLHSLTVTDGLRALEDGNLRPLADAPVTVVFQTVAQ